MSIKLLAVYLFFAGTVIAPVNDHFVGLPPFWPDHNKTSDIYIQDHIQWALYEGHKGKIEKDRSYLWAYLVFTYVFTGLAVYFLTTETTRIIRVRQDYLGSQYTVTDRTFKLSGIPKDLRSEEKITKVLEKLEIGKVESVTLCRNWKELDRLMGERPCVLRKLEEYWTVYIGQKRGKNPESLPVIQNALPVTQSEDEVHEVHEDVNLLAGISSHGAILEASRPITRIWYGFLKLQHRELDAIDYYEERLRRLDEKIKAAREKEYEAVGMAFVTMDSIPACQMAVQALLVPSPMQLLATLAPAPSDIIWTNTYLPRAGRMIRSWAVTIFVIFLTIIWLLPVATFASLLNICSIRKIWPELADVLSRHEIGKALVQTGLPTLVVSLLNVAVPYLYEYLSTLQGVISRSEVELSVISKNFFFTFFNIFLVFTISGTISNFWGTIRDSLSNTTLIAYALANSLQALSVFYTNFILLQGVGLFPLRLLQFGSVFLYPILRMGAKTPRDYANLLEPPIFQYSFYLPSSILILILCIVYSILPAGYQVLFFGLCYFVLGYFTYKYQLLYAMDHPRHATGQAWPMICYRIMIGLGIFQVAMAGVIALKQQFTTAALVLPLIPFTVWFAYFYGQNYEPLTKYIALRSIRRADNPDVNIADEDIGIDHPPGHIRRGSTTIDEEREEGQKFVNPSLVVS
jgi:calcium permeable stress-gated cation channel